MKKILMANELNRLFAEKNSFLDRVHIKIFSAATNDELLKIHREEKADLIITKIDLPGIRSEELFETIRQDKELRETLVIFVCKDTSAQRERCRQCGANEIFTIPVDIALLHAKTQQLLSVSQRKAYRVALTVSVEGKSKNRRFLHRTEDISASGMLIKADEDVLAQGDTISLSFYLPDGMHVDATGEIQRASKQSTAPDSYLYGIKFIDINATTKSAIESFVNKNTTQRYPLAHAI